MSKFFGLILGFFYPLVLVSPAFAAEVKVCPQQAPFKMLCDFTTEKLGNVISNIITILLIIAVVVAVFVLIYGGIKWILSGGDKTAVEAARGRIVSAIVGLVIAFLAFFFLTFILKLFGIDVSTFTIPTLTQ